MVAKTIRLLLFTILLISTATALLSGNDVEISISPDIVEQGETALISADLILDGSTEVNSANFTNVNITIKRIAAGGDITVINNSNMTFLQQGTWIYEFPVSNNISGTYIAIVHATATTIETFFDSKTFFVHGRPGFRIQGISPDLIPQYEAGILAVELEKDGAPIPQGQIENPILTITRQDNSQEIFNISTGLATDTGKVFLNYTFNSTGIATLNWTISYQSVRRQSVEIVAITNFTQDLSGIQLDPNTTELILQNQLLIKDLLQDMKTRQDFSEEKIFLVTDSIQTMADISNIASNEQNANIQNEIHLAALQNDIEVALGRRVTGLQVADKQSLTTLFSAESSTTTISWILIGVGLFLTVAAVLKRNHIHLLSKIHLRRPRMRSPYIRSEEESTQVIEEQSNNHYKQVQEVLDRQGWKTRKVIDQKDNSEPEKRIRFHPAWILDRKHRHLDKSRHILNDIKKSYKEETK